MTAVVAVTLAVTLAACSDSGDSMPTPPATSPSASPSAAPDVTPSEEEPLDFLPGGTALANKDYFDYVNREHFDRHSDSDARSIIDMLVSAGFDKADMQITKDTTPTGRKPEAIEFSVRTPHDCLIGQWGKNTYTSHIVPVLANGDCLIGDTKPIDW